MSGVTASEKSPSLSSTSCADLGEGSQKPHVGYLHSEIVWRSGKSSTPLEGTPRNHQAWRHWLPMPWPTSKKALIPAPDKPFRQLQLSSSWFLTSFPSSLQALAFFATTPFVFIWPGYLSAFSPGAHQIHTTRRLHHTCHTQRYFDFAPHHCPTKTSWYTNCVHTISIKLSSNFGCICYHLETISLNIFCSMCMSKTWSLASFTVVVCTL